MTIKNLGRVTTVLMCFAGAANAGRIASNSSYGGNFSSTPAACTSTPTTSFGSFTFSCSPDGADITAEAFLGSSTLGDGSNPIMFDFLVTDAPANYVLTLTSTGAPINSASDLGLFTCDVSAVDPPQCSNDLPSGVTTASNYGTLMTNNIGSFSVSGATSTDKFVFFVHWTILTATRPA